MNRPSVVVLDYGFGNVRSAQRALERAGATVAVTADHDLATRADGLVVPGVGAFAACMTGLVSVGAPALIAARAKAGAPVLGICVGMQVLFADGVEHGTRTEGLGLLAGEVESLDAPVLPHMGWNTVTSPSGSILFRGVEQGTRFYFVHSYAVAAQPIAVAGIQVATSEHGHRFLAAVEAGSVSGTQFHPEKSGDAGAALLKNWVGAL
ncbi:MAG: imidazole glycerol phosphate synthase subunit HisH [Jatrophihabitans sp.]